MWGNFGTVSVFPHLVTWELGNGGLRNEGWSFLGVIGKHNILVVWSGVVDRDKSMNFPLCFGCSFRAVG
eukprot:3013749-Amphidinium_carterae.2